MRKAKLLAVEDDGRGIKVPMDTPPPPMASEIARRCSSYNSTAGGPGGGVMSTDCREFLVWMQRYWKFVFVWERLDPRRGLFLVVYSLQAHWILWSPFGGYIASNGEDWTEIRCFFRFRHRDKRDEGIEGSRLFELMLQMSIAGGSWPRILRLPNINGTILQESREFIGSVTAI